ncbi:fimbrial isopeptide formation D2 domain-containing protein [Enterococcus faecium EnGen0005]|uniref:isopeptide-forming domain-containing fimbrial protein n=2 Tax=Enterococcus faecium TaxID=1352 RepID=UPI0002A3FB28|nr:isopeptide-forming domain-containing fimbrial protein [Enterococcus faecium]ELA48779.1 fimbrial isopeptide formation D2 domain-containing protein [Enterococcus faecium EnGen0005]
MNFKHSWTRRLKYVFPIMMMLGTLFGLKTANVFAEKVIVDPSNPIQNVKNNFIIPKDVPNAKTNITVNGASKVYKYHVDANKGGFTDDYVGLVEGNKNIRYPSFQKEYGETNLVLEGVTTNTKVNIDYGKIGTYNGEKVNIKLVLSNIHLYSDTLPWNLLDNNYTKTHFRDDGYKNTNGAMSKSKKRTVLWISDNLFSGIVYHSTQMNVQLVATYEDGSPVQFSGDTFISFNSLNPAGGKSTDLKGEYAHYDKMNTTDWYVRKDTVLSEFKSFYNNLNVVGGHPGGSSKLTQADNDFNNLHDKLGDPKFGQGTVSFKISEANPTFVIGSSNVQTWFTLSSATIFSVVPDQPEKTGVDKNGNNVNDKMLQVGDTIQYRIKQKVNRLGVDLLAVYDRFELIDNLPKEVNYVDAHVESGTNKKFDVSGEVTYDKTKHQVKYAAKADTLKNRMKYNGETYELVINVKVNELANQNTPEDVKELLNFMSRFPELSFRNQLLIEEQFPGATACLGRAALKKEGIYIKKGEQGNKIFVRKTVKGFYEKGRGFVRETEATPEDKKRIESGQIEVIKKPYYTIEKVFDITQTQLKPEDYPKIFPNRVFDFQLDKTGQSELQAGIQAVANNIGIQIRDMTESEVYQRELGQARGAYVRNEFTGEEEIVMNTRNTPTQHLATSIHELAHARMHKFSELDTATKELQAEMTSYIVCKHFGMDTSEKAIPYIATWTKNGQTLDDKEAAERGKIMNDVSRVANEFIQTISNEINQYREREPEIQPAEVKQEHKNTLETPENKNIVPVGSLWIDKKDGKVMEEDTGRTLHLKDAAFIEDPQHNQVILKGKSYGKEIQTALPSEEFALGNPFRFSLETVSEVAKRKNEIYHEQQLSQKERV